MAQIDPFIEELKSEAASTRRLLERVPQDHLDFRPHEKSFNLGGLASHIADSIGWAVPTCQMDHFVFDSENWKPWQGDSTAAIVARLDETLAQALEVLAGVSDDDLQTTWTMSDSLGNVFLSMPRGQVLRLMILSHLIHHRGQLTVYLRMLDVPLPAIYGPSADEQQ